MKVTAWGVIFGSHINTDAVTGACRLFFFLQLPPNWGQWIRTNNQGHNFLFQDDHFQYSYLCVCVCVCVCMFVFLCLLQGSLHPRCLPPVLCCHWSHGLELRSGPDSPVVIRWLLNNPQQKYRKYVRVLTEKRLSRNHPTFSLTAAK